MQTPLALNFSRRSVTRIARPLALVAIASAPALALLPGCGGGGGSKSPTTFQTAFGILLQDGNTATQRANLTVTYPDKSSSSFNVQAAFQVIGDVTPTPVAGTAASTGKVTKAGEPFPVNLAPATYLMTGTATQATTTSPLQLKLNGKLDQNVPFTITGTFAPNQNLSLVAKFKAGDGVANLLVLKELNAFPTATPTTTSAPTATPNTTGTPTVTNTPVNTPVPISTSTPTPQPTLTSTPVAF